MDAEKKAKWVSALRSGKYGQCKEKLTNGKNGFCCLGVAYAVCVGADFAVFQRGARDVARLIGIDSSIRDELIAMNDYRDRSFAQIADYIEENL